MTSSTESLAAKMCTLFPPTNQKTGEANREVSEAQQLIGIQQAQRYSPEATSGLAALLSAGDSAAESTSQHRALCQLIPF